MLHHIIFKKKEDIEFKSIPSLLKVSIIIIIANNWAIKY